MDDGLSGIVSLEDVARVLRQLRRREAREQCRPELTYREIAVKTGWSVGAIGGYFSGTFLPSTIRFDTLVRLLGATPAEQGALATARDGVAERRAAAGAAPAGPPRDVPCQLPAVVYDFTGRDDQLARLDELLGAPGARIAAVSGTAGVGKTALAVYWAHRVADQFPDGQLYADLRGFDTNASPLSPAAVARGFLTALGEQAARLPVGSEELIALYRSTLASRRVLLLLDNAHDAAQVRPLLPGMPGSVVVITSRNQLAGLVATNGARSVKLDLLSPAEARTMLARRLGSGPVAAEPEAVTDIIERCCRLPLALAVAAARAAIDELSLVDLAAELGEAGRRLDALGADDAASDVRTVFSWSYRALPDQAARLFRLVGLHPAPDLGVAAAASMLAATPAQTRALLVGLTRANLLTEHTPGRFTCHDLLRAYAGELAAADDGAMAVRRMVDHYCVTAHAAASLVNPARDVDDPPGAAPGVRPEPLADRAEALAWFTAEYPILLATVRIAVRYQFDTSACHLAAAATAYQNLRALWAPWAETLRVGLYASERLGDVAWQAWFHRNLIFAHAWTGDHERSVYHAELAIDLCRAVGDVGGEARCHRHLCMTFERQGNYRQALHHAVRSRDLLQGTDDVMRVAYAFNSVGWYQALVGDFTEALVNCRQAVALLQKHAHPTNQATAWDSLGYVHHNLGQHREALECYAKALALFRSNGERHYQALTLEHLGDTLLATGDHDAAGAAWRDALTLLAAPQHPEAVQIRTKLDGLRRTSDTQERTS
ncbi:tetratricopeptide repeat protein [Paractinoplanes ferrugineus]|nr:tetratricopeptide repeat protein [Actinoplanes ferrugineus]